MFRNILVCAATAAILACSVSSTDSSRADDASALPTPSATPSATSSTPPSPVDAGDARDVAVDASSEQTPLPPFDFVVNGAQRAAVSVVARSIAVGGATSCRRRVRVEATLVPVGAERKDVPPKLTLGLCTTILPSSGDVAFSSDEDLGAELRFRFQLPGEAHFPLANGPGLHVVRDGSDGWFEASASGTFETDTGKHEPFTLQLRQSVK